MDPIQELLQRIYFIATKVEESMTDELIVEVPGGTLKVTTELVLEELPNNIIEFPRNGN